VLWWSRRRGRSAVLGLSGRGVCPSGLPGVRVPSVEIWPGSVSPATSIASVRMVLAYSRDPRMLGMRGDGAAGCRRWGVPVVGDQDLVRRGSVGHHCGAGLTGRGAGCYVDVRRTSEDSRFFQLEVGSGPVPPIGGSARPCWLSW